MGNIGDITFTTRLKHELAAEFIELCDRKGESRSTMLRKLVLRALEEDKREGDLRAAEERIARR